MFETKSFPPGNKKENNINLKAIGKMGAKGDWDFRISDLVKKNPDT